MQKTFYVINYIKMDSTRNTLNLEQNILQQAV
jgi:hypothetical protein